MAFQLRLLSQGSSYLSCASPQVLIVSLQNDLLLRPVFLLFLLFHFYYFHSLCYVCVRGSIKKERIFSLCFAIIDRVLYKIEKLVTNNHPGRRKLGGGDADDDEAPKVVRSARVIAIPIRSISIRVRLLSL